MKDIALIASVTAAVDLDSAAFDLGDLTVFSIAVQFTGTDIIGTLTLESRNLSTDAWVTVASSSQSITASADHIWNVSGAGYRYVRVHWDYTSGTGLISSTLIAKEIRVVGA